MQQRLNYDRVAAGYNRRYAARPHTGTAYALLDLAQTNNPEKVLEVGCGTGHWLQTLKPVCGQVVGLDFSGGMLEQARQPDSYALLVQGRAEQLPFGGNLFDLVFCANAIHHFTDPVRFVTESYRVLRPGGILAIIGMSPPQNRSQWYLYEYFPETFANDRRRYPDRNDLAQWLQTAGFEKITGQQVELIRHEWTGQEVLDDPFLAKDSTSQLTMLSDESYDRGKEKLLKTLESAHNKEEQPVFRVEIEMRMLTAHKP